MKNIIHKYSPKLYQIGDNIIDLNKIFRIEIEPEFNWYAYCPPHKHGFFRFLGSKLFCDKCVGYHERKPTGKYKLRIKNNSIDVLSVMIFDTEHEAIALKKKIIKLLKVKKLEV